MKKAYNVILILVLLVNVFIGIVLFQQSAKLTKYERIISNLEVRMEDLDDAIEDDVVPRLEEILNKKETVNEEDWNISPAFSISKPSLDGKDVPYGLRGIEGKLAIVDGSVIAGMDNKQLFHFWGGTPEKTEQLYNKQVKVIGTSKENGKKVTAFESSIGVPNEEIIKPPHHYAESVGYLNLPSKGIWKLSAYIDDEFFGSIIVNVQEK